MAKAEGIAGSVEPEADGVHLAESFDDALWYASFGVHALVDIWEVEAEGLALRELENGCEWVCLDAIPPERLALAEAGVALKDARRRMNLPPIGGSGLTGGLKVVLKPVDQQDDLPHT